MQADNGDLPAAEAECSRIGTEAEEVGEERVNENQQGSGKGSEKIKNPEDAFKYGNIA